MKFLIASLLLTMSFSSFAAKYGAAGCGLGSMIFEADQTWWKQVLAGTTNATGLQSVAITLGTSNCDAPTPLKISSAQAYVDANKVALANDIARGQGESIVGLSKVYGCQDVAVFSQKLKENYSSIYPHAQVSTPEVTRNIGGVAATACGVKLSEG